MPSFGKMVGSFCCVVALISCASLSGPPEATSKSPKGKEVKVGLLLPLSGPYATYGKYSQNGAECAAGQKAPCAAVGNITLVPKDSGGDASKATAAVRELVEQDHVSAIVGPLMSNDAIPVAQEAERLRVPLVSLSQRDGVAEVGAYTFRIAMSAESQMQTLSGYAVKERGLHHFAILYPNNKLGEQYRTMFRDAVTKLGGEITVDRSYPAALPEQLAAYLHPKKTASDEAIVVVGESDAASSPLPTFAGIKGVDAVFIPDSYQAVVGMLKAYGSKIFGGATLLGTNRWNSPGLLEAGKAAEGLVFVDGFFKQSSAADVSRFVSNFSQAYGVEPTILEAQAYDAVALVSQAAGRSGATAERVQSGLSRIRKFHGVSGDTHFTGEGDAQKELFILTVTDGTVQEVGKRTALAANIVRTGDPAPLVANVRRARHPKYDVGGEATAESASIESTKKYDDLQ